MQANENTWSDYVALLRRRRRPAGIVTALIAIGSIYVAYTLPAVYESTATILIEQQGVPEEFIQTTVNAYAEQLLQTINQRVVAAPRVSQLIDKFGLYADDVGSVPEEELIWRFRDHTDMTPQNVTSVHARTGREAIVTFGFQVSFQYPDAVKARDVATELSNLFVSQNADLRAEAAGRTTAFLDAEAADLERQLDEFAERIADFKTQHEHNLPDDQGINLQTWERLRDELTMVESRQREVRETQALLQTEIVDTPRYRPIMDNSGEPVIGAVDRLAEAQQELIRLRGRYSESHPSIIALRREVAALSASPVTRASLAQDLEIELQIKRQELAAARGAYSESHPDVVNLRSTVRALESRLEDLEREIATSPSGERAEPNNPVYLQLRTRIATSNAELADLRQRRQELQARIDELDRRRFAAPQAERDYTALTQERAVLLERYRELRNLGAEAAMGQALEAGQSGQRFTIVEPARIPASPVSPNRISLSFLGIVLALAIGLGVASLLEAMDTRVRGRQDIYQLLEAPPIGIIPYVESRRDAVRRRIFNTIMSVILLGSIAHLITIVMA